MSECIKCKYLNRIEWQCMKHPEMNIYEYGMIGCGDFNRLSNDA